MKKVYNTLLISYDLKLYVKYHKTYYFILMISPQPLSKGEREN
jgi:hypothetical protein